jgi:uncharacterized membrane protein
MRSNIQEGQRQELIFVVIARRLFWTKMKEKGEAIMTNNIMHNIKDSSIWKRGLYMLLCAIFYSIAEVVVFAVVIFQFILKLFTGETNKRLLKLGQSLATYIYQIVQFLNFNSEHLPYPFSGWPRAEPKDVRTI